MPDNMTNDINETQAITQEQINTALPNLRKYSQENRIPYLKNEYRKEMLIKFKELFLCELYTAAENEKKYCEEKHVEPHMQGATLAHVESLVADATDWFELEALYEFIFVDIFVPTKEEVQEKAMRIRANFGGLVY